jgi:hypothetical protein
VSVSHLYIEIALSPFSIERKVQEASLLLEEFVYGYSVYHFLS